MKENSMAPIKITVGNGNTLIDVIVKEQHQRITFDMLKEIWHDISNGEIQDIEYINADVFGEFVVCCASVSQGQGGIVFIWDTNKQRIVHYSDGRFAVKATIHDNTVYVLRVVSYWGVPAHLELDCCDFGTMSEESNVTPIELDGATSSNLADSPADYIVDFDGNTPVIKLKNKSKCTS